MLALTLIAAGAPPVAAQDPPAPLPDEAVRIIESLSELEPQAVQLDREAPCCVVDAGAPAVAIRAMLDRLAALRLATAATGRPASRAWGRA